MKILFLYTELADYFLKCCEKLSESCEVHIVRWPVNKEAPFKFEFSDRIRVYDKSQYDFPELQKLTEKVKPSLIVCSGWLDRDYLKITKNYFRKIPTVMSCDTHWKGTLKQHLAILLSRFTLLRIFSHAWVPGMAQYKYVRKLGFKETAIRQGFYSCDLESFNGFFKKRDASGATKKFLYVGRYYDFKGVQDLWTAFVSLSDAGELEGWELWCLGAGSLVPVKHPKIRHLGFVQPKDLQPLIDECSVFVLPSHYEPWGVVVQEYAAAGFPLILSNKVGAREKFLREGENGYTFEAKNISELKECLKKIGNTGGKQLLSMSQSSHDLAQSVSPASWSKTLLNLIYENQKK